MLVPGGSLDYCGPGRGLADRRGYAFDGFGPVIRMGFGLVRFLST